MKSTNKFFNFFLSTRQEDDERVQLFRMDLHFFLQIFQNTLKIP
jgi:hypothetical protein